MKKLVMLFLVSSTCLFYACQSVETETIAPQATQKAILENKNLRPSEGEKPDLKIFPFFVSGSVTLSSGSYKIPISLKELNIGTASSGYGSDTLKVYQKIPTPIVGIYTFRFLQNYVRTAAIPIGGTWYLNAIVNFPAIWRPASGKINLVIKADGGNTIYESNESNNLSDTIWNIVLP